MEMNQVFILIRGKLKQMMTLPPRFELGCLSLSILSIFGCNSSES